MQFFKISFQRSIMINFMCTLFICIFVQKCTDFLNKFQLIFFRKIHGKLLIYLFYLKLIVFLFTVSPNGFE